MKTGDLKYLLVWLLPVCGLAGFYFGSWFSPGSFYLAFIIIPLVEYFLPLDSAGSEKHVPDKSDRTYFDYLLYLNLPVLYFLIGYFLFILATQKFAVTNLIFLVLNMGILMGVLGINVAHELGHRNNWYDRLISQMLLLPCLYMHFTRLHNLWHHKYVATSLDTASADQGESVYAFWFKSIYSGFLQAVAIEKRIMNEKGYGFWNWNNRLLIQCAIELVYLLLIFYFVGIIGIICMIFAALIAVLLLETINYIEHYGLKRKKTAALIFEKVGYMHSWNSNHSLGRIFLYELTRHPHHHEKSTVKYQSLQNFADSPQLPYGYPASLLLSLIPLLWFRIMNPRLPNSQEF
jgi:alkane 1-monooxygenase